MIYTREAVWGGLAPIVYGFKRAAVALGAETSRRVMCAVMLVSFLCYIFLLIRPYNCEAFTSAGITGQSKERGHTHKFARVRRSAEG